MSKLLSGRAILTILLLGFSLYFVVVGYGYGPNSRIFPVGVGVPTAILMAIALVGIWKPNFVRWAEVQFGDDPSGTERSVTEKRRRVGLPVLRLLRMLGWLLLANVAVALFGFQVALPLFIALFSRVEGHTRWGVCILVGVLSWTFMIGYFDLLMDSRLFRGILFGDLLPLF